MGDSVRVAPTWVYLVGQLQVGRHLSKLEGELQTDRQTYEKTHPQQNWYDLYFYKNTHPPGIRCRYAVKGLQLNQHVSWEPGPKNPKKSPEIRQFCPCHTKSSPNHTLRPTSNV